MGQSVLVHGAARAVGSMATQFAHEAGAYVIGTGRAAHRQPALDFGAQEFVDLENDALEDVGGVDLVFDVFGGAIGKRSARLVIGQDACPPRVARQVGNVLFRYLPAFAPACRSCARRHPRNTGTGKATMITAW